MNSLSSSVNSLEWRRSKVLELSSQGHSQLEIARILQVILIWSTRLEVIHPESNQDLVDSIFRYVYVEGSDYLQD